MQELLIGSEIADIAEKVFRRKVKCGRLRAFVSNS